MAIGRIVKTAIKFAPVAYPIIRKAMNKRKAGKVAQSTSSQSKR